MKYPIYFVRHGQTDWNAEMRFQGQMDIPVNTLGREQARRNGRLLRDLLPDPASFDFVASPLSRTRETMELVRGELGLDPSDYRTDDRLIEINYGDWEGSTLEEMERANPDLFAARTRDKWNTRSPGAAAESYAMQAERFAPWLGEVERPTVCVTHGGILRCIWNLLGGLSGHEASMLTIPQDRVLRFDKDGLEWL